MNHPQPPPDCRYFREVKKGHWKFSVLPSNALTHSWWIEDVKATDDIRWVISTCAMRAWMESRLKLYNELGPYKGHSKSTTAKIREQIKEIELLVDEWGKWGFDE